MILWGFIFLLAGLLTSLILFLNNLGGMIDRLQALGFGGYVEAFFDTANLNAGKVVFVVALAVAVLGLVLYLVGRAKNKGEKNPIIPAKMSKFFRDVKGEFKKIVWPTFGSVVRNTGMVLLVCAITAALIVLVDLGLGQLVDLLVNL